MPGKLRAAPKGASPRAKQKIVSKNIREFTGGQTFRRTRRKFGAARARKQAVAAALNAARRGRPR